MVDLAIIERIEAELPAIHKRVLARTARMVRSQSWTRKTGMPGGKEPGDLVQEALSRILEGERVWDPNAVGLELFLVGVIRSLVSSDVEGLDNKRVGSLEREESPVAYDGAGRITSPEVVLLDAKRCQELADELLTAVGDDPVLQKIGEELLDGIHKSDAKEIAAATGLDIKVVYNGTKKLQRRLDKAATRRQT